MNWSRRTIQKRISLKAHCLCVSYIFDSVLQGSFLTRVALAMPSCDGYAGRYIQAEKILSGFGGGIELNDMNGVVLDDGVLGGTLQWPLSKNEMSITLTINPGNAVL